MHQSWSKLDRGST